MDDTRPTPYSRLQHTHQFVSKKVRRVRWQKLPQTASISAGILPEKFATASWDEGFETKNEIVLWHLTAEEVGDDEAKRPRRGDITDDDQYSLTNMPETDWKFVQSSKIEVDSDIHEMQFLNEDHIVFGTANGDIAIAKWSRPERQLRTIQVFEAVHGTGEGCVGFSLLGNDVVSLGTHGTMARINLNAVFDKRNKTAIENGNTYGATLSSSGFGPLLCIEHFGANDIVTGNAIGQLQLWDLRQRPLPRKQLPSGIQGGGAVTAIRAHPSQLHIVAVGYQTGDLAFWDLRKDALSMTASAVDIHNGPIWEMQFHPIYTSHLYTASNDGRVLHWDASNIKLTGDFSVSPWSLSTEQLRDQLKLTSLIPDNSMPINSLDVVGDALLAGVDDESVWMVKNLPLS